MNPLSSALEAWSLCKLQSEVENNIMLTISAILYFNALWSELYAHRHISSHQLPLQPLETPMTGAVCLSYSTRFLPASIAWVAPRLPSSSTCIPTSQYTRSFSREGCSHSPRRWLPSTSSAHSVGRRNPMVYYTATATRPIQLDVK